LYETGGMDEENTDTQVSVLVCSVNLKACFLLSHNSQMRERERRGGGETDRQGDHWRFGENCVMVFLICTVFFTKYYWSDQLQNGELEGTCHMLGKYV